MSRNGSRDVPVLRGGSLFVRRAGATREGADRAAAYPRPGAGLRCGDACRPSQLARAGFSSGGRITPISRTAHPVRTGLIRRGKACRGGNSTGSGSRRAWVIGAELRQPPVPGRVGCYVWSTALHPLLRALLGSRERVAHQCSVAAIGSNRAKLDGPRVSSGCRPMAAHLRLPPGQALVSRKAGARGDARALSFT